VEGEALKFFRTRTTFSGREGFGIVPGVREMLVTFERTDAGARVTVTHSGWADDEESERERRTVERGTDETLADLLLYLRSGVPFPRHNRGERSHLGLVALEVPGGVEVRGVQPGSFADRLGLARGDLLVELDGAGVFGLSDLVFFAKLRAAGETAGARWIRDGALLQGSAVLGDRMPPP
jgi:predicted metalloprotease with PDZ domain